MACFLFDLDANRVPTESITCSGKSNVEQRFCQCCVHSVCRKKYDYLRLYDVQLRSCDLRRRFSEFKTFDDKPKKKKKNLSFFCFVSSAT